MNRRLLKLTLALLLIAGIAAFFVLDLARFLTLDAIQAQRTNLAALAEDHPVLLPAGFFAAYVAVAALSLPGAAVMTLLGGALFGLVQGLVLVSFASTLGATLAFLASRFLLRDTIQQRFGERMAAINRGLAKDGAFYLFTLRLVPVFPFFVINLLMGLTPVGTWTFAWVSQLGMLAGTAVFVNAGTQLAELRSLSGILSPALIGSFVLLGVFPLIAKAVIGVVRSRRVYAGWTKPKTFDRNLIVIGAGAAGLVTAYIASAVKAKVTLIESHAMGGDCLNAGCVPSKALIRSARLAAQTREAAALGFKPVPDLEVDFAAVMARIQRVIAEIAPHDSVARYTALGVDVQIGRARIVDPWTVTIDGKRLTTRSIVIAAGAEPLVPPLPGLEHCGYLTSETLWRLTEKPRRMLVLGGGPIGCELSQAFARLGVAVTLVEAADRLLIREDDEVSAYVKARLESEGVQVLLGHKAVAVDGAVVGTVDGAVRGDGGHDGQAGQQGALRVESGTSTVLLPFDQLLLALGRRARTSGYGLEELGIPLTPTKTIETNDYLQTLYPNIHACGDVAGPYQFTHVAAHQAWYAAVNSLFGTFRRFRADYSVIPAVTFTDPEVARVGLNEREARAKNVPYEVTHYGIDDLDRAIAESSAAGSGNESVPSVAIGAATGFVKVLTVPGRDRILGATIVGEHAGETLAEFTLAMRHGIGLNGILATIHPYPTFSEANKYVAGNWKRAHAPERLLRWVERYHAWRR